MRAGTHFPHPRRQPVAATAVVFVVAVTIALAGCTPDAEVSEAESSLPGVAVPLPDPAEPLSLAELGAFTGVLRLDMGSNCTGTLIDTGVEDGPAYVITNGHCTGDVGRAPQRVTVGTEWFGQGYLLDTYDNPSPLVVNAAVLEYSTMRGRDVSIVRLEESLGYLRGLGIQPVPIIDEEPAAGTEVRNIAAPVQNLDHDDWVLRSGDCTLAHQTDLLEFRWLWSDAWANDCPGVIQGSSGSPLFALDADGGPASIAAVINTTTAGSSKENGGLCFLNRPCELGEQGIAMVEGTSYAVSVAGIGRCFDDAGVFALGDDCPLETSSVWANSGGGIFRGGDLPDATGSTPDVGLVTSEAFGGDAPVRTALVALTSAAVCTDPSAYAGAESTSVPAGVEEWDPGQIIPITLPDVEGHYALCAVAGDDYAGAAAVLFEVDRTPPIFAAGASVEDLGDGHVWVSPFLNPPEISTVRFTWVPGDVACPATDQFQDFFIVPLLLEPDQLPATYCIYALDAAGNTTEVTRIPIAGG
ncbi:trypsin-like serine peptidase [Microbacterium sp.]|uniref:trypsin-like serine peptidase n=1 Tax=Microbacterium sp. TaxID=51671 RepID=UPI0039E61058